MKENQLIEWALQGNQEAIAFCQIIFDASQVLDDLIDGDKPVEREAIIAAWWNMLIALPNNRFYVSNLPCLTPALQRSLTDWFDANALEHEDEAGKNIAFVLRDSVSALLIDCAFIVGGYAWGRQVSLTIRKAIHDESLEDYKGKLEGSNSEPNGGGDKQ